MLADNGHSWACLGAGGLFSKHANVGIPVLITSAPTAPVQDKQQAPLAAPSALGTAAATGLLATKSNASDVLACLLEAAFPTEDQCHDLGAMPEREASGAVDNVKSSIEVAMASKVCMIGIRA